ncbi:MAG: serine hydrolase [Cyclobacteriaceae bacterium]
MFFLNRLLLIVTWIGISLAEPVMAQEEKQSAAIDEIFSRYHQFEHFQGAVLVAKKGEVFYKKAFGLANREWNIPNQPDTRFDIASISKQFTAMLVMQLIEEGKIHPDSSLSTYLPEYRQDVGSSVSIHHLLTHTSGIPNYTSIPYVWSDSLVRRYTSSELIRKFCSGDLEFAPGTQYSYNNSGYLLLSVVVERVSGKSFEEVLHERILQPLRMQHSGIDDRSRIIDKRAYGYVREVDGFTNASPMDMANLQGAGNMYATVEDLYLWDRALHQQKLLSRRGHLAMNTAYTTESDTWISPYTNSYGYGVGLTRLPGMDGKETQMVFHSGHITGYSSFMARFVEDEHLVVILSNIGNLSTARMNEIAQEVRNVLNETPHELPERSMHLLLVKAALQGGAESAIEQYYQLKNDFPYEFTETENDLLLAANDLNSNNMDGAALEILKLNMQVNPGWKSFFLLGEAYYQQQKYKEAARLYRKSMRVNPRQSEEEKDAYTASEKALNMLNQ